MKQPLPEREYQPLSEPGALVGCRRYHPGAGRFAPYLHPCEPPVMDLIKRLWAATRWGRETWTNSSKRLGSIFDPEDYDRLMKTCRLCRPCTKAVPIGGRPGHEHRWRKKQKSENMKPRFVEDPPTSPSENTGADGWLRQREGGPFKWGVPPEAQEMVCHASAAW
jgi:hypothetical protein